jgi:mono/diheme cytochrome c family protein
VSRTNIFIRFLLFPLGAALLIAVFLFQEGTALSAGLQSTPEATLSPFERLAEPTLPAAPAQADHGAQIYWLWCLPCHGDRGQGLTDEFRETYPPEEQYCWERGCHGERPYEYGFKLPMQIPAVIGPEAALGKFQSAARLNAYIQAAMPYWKPGSLQEEENWQVTAFLLRENDIWDTREVLDSSNADQILLLAETPAPSPAPPLSPTNRKQPAMWAVILIVFLLGGFLFLWRIIRRNPSQS